MLIKMYSIAEFYHSEKLQSTKTKGNDEFDEKRFYHSEKLQSTKTTGAVTVCTGVVLS